MKPWPGRRPISGAFISVALALGCAATLPDITPFAEQAARMASGVKGGYTQAETLLSLTDLERALVDSLHNAWAPTKQTLNAVVAYSRAIADLAQTGREGRAAAEQVIGGLQGIAATLGVPVPGVAAPIGSAVAAVNGYIARIRTRRTLSEILAEAQPAIDTIAWAIGENLSALERVTESAGRRARTLHLQQHQSVVAYYENLVAADTLALRTLSTFLLREMALETGDNERAGARLADLKGLDPRLSDENVEERHRYWLIRSRSVREESGRYLREYEAFRARQAEINQLRVNGSAVLRTARSALEAWASAHRKILRSLEEEWPLVNLVEFAVAVQDVYDAYQGR